MGTFGYTARPFAQKNPLLCLLNLLPRRRLSLNAKHFFALNINRIAVQVHGAGVRVEREADGQVRRVLVRGGAPGAHHRAQARGRVAAAGRGEPRRMGGYPNLNLNLNLQCSSWLAQ